MGARKSLLLICLQAAAACLAGGFSPARGVDGTSAVFHSRADALPRKVVVASVVATFQGTTPERLDLARALAAEALTQAQRLGSERVDLLVFPEFAWMRAEGASARERAVSLDDGLGEALGALARSISGWVIAPMILHESDGQRISNAAVLFDRAGHVAGIYRKHYPVVEADGRFEGGVTPGADVPVFSCDFGRVGILICWDMSYPELWRTLVHGGAELIAVPSASPQTLRPAAEALRHHVYVLTSTPRNNASLFDPIGRTTAQVTGAPAVLVQKLDLAYAVLHWSEELRSGEALKERFGEDVNVDYSSREDTGVFSSNHPARSIGSMIRELGLRELPEEIDRMQRARRRMDADP